MKLNLKTNPEIDKKSSFQVIEALLIMLKIPKYKIVIPHRIVRCRGSKINGFGASIIRMGEKNVFGRNRF